MQSKKRFTESNIWSASWFMDLTNDQKLFWGYLNDQCDNIGVWDSNFKLASFHLGIENFEDFFHQFIDTINSDHKRIYEINKEQWLLIEFVKFQYCKKSPLNRKNPAHKSYLNLIVERKLSTWFCENQPDVLSYEDLSDFYVLNPKTTLDKRSSRGLKEVSESYKEKDPDKVEDKKTDTDEDTPPEHQETSLEFEMRSKGMLNGSPLS